MNHKNECVNSYFEGNIRKLILVLIYFMMYNLLELNICKEKSYEEEKNIRIINYDYDALYGNSLREKG